MSTYSTGKTGETVACEYISRRGYLVLCRNYRFDGGEIDIIAEDYKYIVFAEVKLRRRVEVSRYGRPSAAVTKQKQARILKGAECWLRAHDSDKQPRVDVLEIIYDELSDGGASFEINHIKGAFTR